MDMEKQSPPSLRVIGGLDEALRHGRGEIGAKVHKIPLAALPRPRRVPSPPARANTFRHDLSELIHEIRAAPVSHAIVAVAAVVGWTVLLVAPILIGDLL